MAETKPANPPAFPTFEEIDHWDRDAEKYRESIAPVGGMSLRDHFAAKAMPECIRIASTLRMRETNVLPWSEPAARAAYEMADAMLKAREQ